MGHHDAANLFAIDTQWMLAQVVRPEPIAPVRVIAAARWSLASAVCLSMLDYRMSRAACCCYEFGTAWVTAVAE